MDDMQSGDEKNDSHSMGTSFEPLFSDSDGTSSLDGFWGTVAHRCFRKFSIEVKKDFELTDRAVGTAGLDYCIQTGKATPVAHVTYLINPKTTFRFGWRKTKLKYKGAIPVLGQDIVVVPSVSFNHQDRNLHIGVKFKDCGNFSWLWKAAGFLMNGQKVDKKLTLPITDPTDSTSGLKTRFQMRGRRRGMLLDGGLRELEAVIQLGPRLMPLLRAEMQQQMEISDSGEDQTDASGAEEESSEEDEDADQHP